MGQKGNKPKVDKAIVGNAVHPLPLRCTVVFIRELVELAQKQRAPLCFVNGTGLLHLLILKRYLGLW